MMSASGPPASSMNFAYSSEPCAPPPTTITAPRDGPTRGVDCAALLAADSVNANDSAAARPIGARDRKVLMPTRTNDRMVQARQWRDARTSTIVVAHFVTRNPRIPSLRSRFVTRRYARRWPGRTLDGPTGDRTVRSGKPVDGSNMTRSMHGAATSDWNEPPPSLADSIG